MDGQLFEREALKLKLPAGLIVAGPSSSGKTVLIMRLIADYRHLITPTPSTIIYAYGQYHERIPELQRTPHVRVHAGLPSEELLEACHPPVMLILDDLMMEASEKFLTDLFTRRVHHMRLFTVFVVQNLFDRSCRVARLNSQYLILTRSPNAVLSVRTLGTQLFPGAAALRYFMDAYEQSTKRAYGYLMVDTHPASDPLLRLRTHIFPSEGDGHQIIFLPKSF